jgi:hypothetical protein
MTKTETSFLSLGYGHCIEQTLDRQLRQLSAITRGQKHHAVQSDFFHSKNPLFLNKGGVGILWFPVAQCLICCFMQIGIVITGDAV